METCASSPVQTWRHAASTYRSAPHTPSPPSMHRGVAALPPGGRGVRPAVAPAAQHRRALDVHTCARLPACLPSAGPAVRHQHDAARQIRGLHPPVSGWLGRVGAGAVPLPPAECMLAASPAPAPAPAPMLPPRPPCSVGRVGRHDTMGLAISLVATVPEKVGVAAVPARAPALPARLHHPSRRSFPRRSHAGTPASRLSAWPAAVTPQPQPSLTCLPRRDCPPPPAAYTRYCRCGTAPSRATSPGCSPTPKTPRPTTAAGRPSGMRSSSCCR